MIATETSLGFGECHEKIVSLSRVLTRKAWLGRRKRSGEILFGPAESAYVVPRRKRRSSPRRSLQLLDACG